MDGSWENNGWSSFAGDLCLFRRLMNKSRMFANYLIT